MAKIGNDFINPPGPLKRGTGGFDYFFFFLGFGAGSEMAVDFFSLLSTKTEMRAIICTITMEME